MWRLIIVVAGLALASLSACSSADNGGVLVDAGVDAGDVVDGGPPSCGALPDSCGLDCSRFPYDCFSNWQSEPQCLGLCSLGHCCDCILSPAPGMWRRSTIDCAVPMDGGQPDAGH
jgi:hypothetical protein